MSKKQTVVFTVYCENKNALLDPDKLVTVRENKNGYRLNYQSGTIEVTGSNRQEDNCPSKKVEMETLGGTVPCIVGVGPVLVQDSIL